MKIIDEILPTRGYDHPWSLVKNLDQAEFELPTLSPVADFHIEFIGMSVEDVDDHFRDLYQKLFEPRSSLLEVSSETFAIVDERGLKEKNLLIVHWYFKHDEGEGRIADETEVWRTLRIPFFSATGVAFAMDENDYLYFDEAMGYPGSMLTDDGIFVIPGSEEKYAQHGLTVRKS